jgi:transposase
MSKARKKSTASNVLENTNLTLVNPDAAGIDIGSEEHWVCVPPDRAKHDVRKFGAFTNDLYAIATWLSKCNIKTVAMESTGVYWIPLFQVLEKSGFEVYLVNGRHIKNVPGRSKTDRLDCKWIQKLHSFGLLSPSFRPEDEICKLRAFLRHRDNLIRFSAQHIQHIQKSLHQMNLLLDKVVSDVTGVTGLRILEAILAGERDPVKLAKLKDPRVFASQDEIARALHGDYREEHLFVLRQSLDFYKYIRKQIINCDREVERLLKKMDRKINSKTSPLPSKTSTHRKPQRNDPTFDLRTHFYEILGVDATQIPGFQTSTVQTLTSEAGIDMSKWKNEKYFTSWLALCPDPDISGGKTIKNKTKKSQNRAALALRRAARSLSRSQSWLGAFYRRMRARIGGPKAITAAAHKLAIVYYLMVKNGTEYKELGEDYYIKHNEKRALKKITQQAKKLGYDLVPQPA